MTRTSSLRRTTGHIALTFGRQFLAGLLQLGQILIVARLLGPEGVGAFALALLLPTVLAQLLNLGLASANIYFVASDQFPLSQVWPASRDLAALSGVVGLVLGGGVIWVWGDLLFPGVPALLLYSALLALPASLLSAIVTGLFQAKQDFRSFNAIVLVQPVVALAATGLLWAFDSVTVNAVVLTAVAAYLSATVAGLVRLSQMTPLVDRSGGRVAYLRVALGFGLKAHLANMLNFLNYRIDLFLVNFFIGPAGAGLYTVAVRLVEQLWMISQAVSTVLFPRLSAMAHDEAGRKFMSEFMSRAVLWTTLLASVMLSLLAVPIIALLFGPQFTGAASAVIILLPGVVVFSSARVLANTLAARGWVGVNLAMALAVLTINSAANLVLIQKFGIAGAAAATSLAYCLTFLAYLGVGAMLAGVSPLACLIPSAQDMALVSRLLKRKTS